MVPTFVVGTGRCGSTMLSNMLREHPQILSLSEFFGILVDGGGRLAQAFCGEQMDGRRFWGVVSEAGPFTSFCLSRRIPCEEWLYPIDAPGARYCAQTGVPAILVTALPHLTDDHDALFAVLEEEVSGWPAETIGVHYERLFGWLAARFHKQLWVERSGAGLSMIAPILATFPDARFIHVVRDGRDAALSMQEHLLLRAYFVMSSLGQVLGANPIESADRTRVSQVPAELRRFLPEQFDAEALQAYRVPLPLCAEFWTSQIVSGLDVLQALPAGRLLTLRYEDVLAEPRRQLDRLAAFLGEDFVDAAWSTRCAGQLRKPRSTWRDQPAEIGRSLSEACEPGFARLRAAGVGYEA